MGTNIAATFVISKSVYALEQALEIVRLYSGFMLETITLGNKPKNNDAKANVMESPLNNIASFAFLSPIKCQLRVIRTKAPIIEIVANLLLNRSV